MLEAIPNGPPNWHDDGVPWDQERFRTVGVQLPPALVVALDDFKPTQKSRSWMIAEAIQEFLARRGIEVEIPDGLYRPMIAIHERGRLGRIQSRPADD